ncbi:MAG: polyprenyl synthetase family protein, partial [Planctomycetota bacterium]
MAGAEALRLKALLSDPPADVREQVMALPETAGALRSAGATAQQRADRAIARLAVLPDGPAKSLLQRLARFSVGRTK